MYKEDLLHFVWQHRLIDQLNLTTKDGHLVEVLKPGLLNSNAGPDFMNARVKIGDNIWAGSVEAHCKSSNWYDHKHQLDTAYNNVVLHIVWECDLDTVSNQLGEEIPQLIIDVNSIPKSTLLKYNDLQVNKDSIPCAHFIAKVDALSISHCLERMFIERLENKVERIESSLQNSQGDWEIAFLKSLFRQFGFGVNADAFQQLAESNDLNILRKNADSILKLEALLYGQAGMLELPNLEDAYIAQLKTEWNFLKNKYNLSAVYTQLKMMRLRPANFPFLRLSQLAHFISKSEHLFSKVVEAKNLKEVMELLNLNGNEFWKNHSTFQKEKKNASVELGKSSKELIVINVVIPFLFEYGNRNNQENVKEKALLFADELKAESNFKTRKFETIGIIAKSALQSQAMIQLHDNYCTQAACLKCMIGTKILKQE